MSKETKSESSHVTDPARLVNTFAGNFDEGHTFEGAALPFGMVQFGPDYTKTTTGRCRGFSLTHVNGAGGGNRIAGDFPLFPFLGEISVSPATHPATYLADITRRNACPGSYEAGLSNGITVNLAAGRRCGYVSFAPSFATPLTILLNTGVTRSLKKAPGSVDITGTDQVRARTTGGDFCHDICKEIRFPNSRYSIFCAIRFMSQFRSSGTWDGDTLASGSTSAESTECGAYLTFDASPSHPVIAAIGISYVNSDNAFANLEAEGVFFDIGIPATNARAQWNQRLGQIEVKGIEADMASFYTALYHVMLTPNVFNDANGEYCGFDHATHKVDNKDIYSNFSGWDVYRNQMQLVTILAPDVGSGLVRMLMLAAQQSPGGGLPKWTLANVETSIMCGDPAAALIASVYAFGGRDFDHTEALRIMRHGAENPAAAAANYQPTRLESALYLKQGWIPEGTCWDAGSLTLEYALADFCIAQFAKALDETNTYHDAMKRSHNWHTLLNSWSGWLEARKSDGTFISPGKSVWAEGSKEQYFWGVPHDIGGLIQEIGGKEYALKRLDTFFTPIDTKGYGPTVYMGNEPSMHTPWIYNWAGAPHKTQDVVRRIMDRFWRDTNKPFIGEDDLGTMSAWYVFAAIGMYPFIPGVAGFSLSAPIFTSIVIHLGNGAEIRINGGSPDRQYIHGMSIDGKEHCSSWLPYEVIGNGAMVTFTLDNVPGTTWGTDEQYEPPSFGI